MSAGPGAGRRRIYLMRHAEVSYFTPAGEPVDPRHVVLTERGRAQVAGMAEALAAVPFDRAVSSGVPRAHETAAAILAGRGIAIEDEPGFREMKAGRLRDVAPERRHAALVRVFETAAAAGAAFAGGETFAAFEARVLAAFERTLRGPEWRRLLRVAHDGVNRIILAWAAQRSWRLGGVRAGYGLPQPHRSRHGRRRGRAADHPAHELHALRRREIAAVPDQHGARLRRLRRGA